MKHTIVAERYAEALFSLAQELKQEDAWGENLQALLELLAEHTELQKFLLHPVVHKKDKHEVLNQLFSGKLPTELLNFLHLLVDKKRENYFKEIALEYQRLLNQMHKKVVAEVVTAIPLASKTEAKLKTQLEQYLGQSVEMHCETEPSILGGFQVKIGDRMIDGSLKTQLAGLAQALVQ